MFGTYLKNEVVWFLVERSKVKVRVLGKADPGTFFQCKNIEEGNAIIEDGKRQVFFLNIKKIIVSFCFLFFSI